MKRFLIIAVVIITVLAFFFKRTIKTITTAPRSSPGKKEQVNRQLGEIGEWHKNATPVEKAIDGIEMMHYVIREFERDKGRLPKDLDELLAATHRSGRKFCSEENIVDPWGGRYVYRADQKVPGGIRISSAGPDRTPGTDDDIRAEPSPDLPLLFKKTPD